jgi:hypothetical protein
MDKLPLEGLRILDFTVVWAGPFAAMLLADYGAEVIRVESLQFFPSVTRGVMARPDKAMVSAMPGYAGAYPDRDPGPRPWNRHPMFNPHARNKLGMTVISSVPRDVSSSEAGERQRCVDRKSLSSIHGKSRADP